MQDIRENTAGWLTTKEIMRHLALPKSTFEMLVKKGMPVLRIGKVRRFQVAEVEAWLKTLGR
jgi:excisionase family DNA binding protein